MSFIETEEKVREPLFQVEKREKDVLPIWKSILVRAIAILAAFALLSLLSIWIAKLSPVEFVSKMFEGAFGTKRRIWIFVRNVAVLLCFAVALAPAFKMRFWNIGAEGQVLMGGLACAACMYYLGGKMADELVYVFMIVTGIIAGAVWAVIPAIFKAFWNTNETLFTLMMNYIAMQFVAFFTNVWVKDGSNTLKNATHLHGIKFPPLGNEYLIPVIVVALLIVFMFVYLRFSKHGYELSVVGESEKTAKYIGINVKKVIIRTMILSGAICGVAGVLIVGCINGTLNMSSAGGQGFTGIIVAWIGKFNPVYMVLSSALLIFMSRGTSNLSLSSDSFSLIATGIMVFFIIGCEFFINYKIRIHGKKKLAKHLNGGKEKALENNNGGSR